MKENGKTHSHNGGNGAHQYPDEIPDVSYIKNPDILHEPSDVSIRGIAYFIAILGVSTFLIMVGLVWLYNFFESQAVAEERARPPATLIAPPPSMTTKDGQRLPPEPRLQGIVGHEIHPLDELKQLNAQYDARLKGYGWIDQSSGTVHIPIDRAKALIIERGLPVSAPTQAPPTTPTAPTDTQPPGESSGAPPAQSPPARQPTPRP